MQADDVVQEARAEAEPRATADAAPAESLTSTREVEAVATEEDERLRTIATALNRFPTELTTVEQAMDLSGCCHREALPRMPRGGGSVADAKRLLHGVWRRVLDLARDEADALDELTPFGSLGGDSTSAIAVASLASRHGLELRGIVMAVETMTIDDVARAAVARAQGGTRRGSTLLAATGGGGGDGESGERGEHSSDSASGDGGAKSRAGDTLASSARRIRIIERDRRQPMVPLRDVGGIGACAVGNLAEARTIAEAGWLPAYAADKHGSTALMWAAGGGHLPVVRWLLEEVGVAVDATNKVDRTALQWACKTGQLEVVRYLLDAAGADPTARMKDDSTAFDWAVLSGHLPTMELLAEHPRVDIHSLNKFGCVGPEISNSGRGRSHA